VVELRRRLACRSAACELDLAISLAMLFNCLAELKRWKEGLAALEEATEIRDRLAASLAPELAPGLATTLTLLKSCGRRISGHVTLGESTPTFTNKLAALVQERRARPDGETTDVHFAPAGFPSAPRGFTLHMMQGPGAPRLFVLGHRETILGRSSQVDIQIDAFDLSRMHASIHREDGEYRILDLDSRNGVYLNGIRIHSAVLRHGDNVQLGLTILVYCEHDGPEG